MWIVLKSFIWFILNFYISSFKFFICFIKHSNNSLMLEFEKDIFINTNSRYYGLDDNKCVQVTFSWKTTSHKDFSEVFSTVQSGLIGKSSSMKITLCLLIILFQLSCCGTQSYQDWMNTTFSMSSYSVPDSCCITDVVGCGRGILSIDAHQVKKHTRTYLLK